MGAARSPPRIAPQAKPKTRAARAKRHIAKPGDTYLKRRSLRGRSSADLYKQRVQEFKAWAVLKRRPLSPEAKLDASFETYFDKVFFDGAGITVPRYILWAGGMSTTCR